MNDMIKHWLTQIQDSASILPEDIPNIDLYMDQVLTLLEDQLQDTKRYDEDKIMTKTMINNYSKEKLLPPSNKKKYSKHHIELLNLIYQYKPILAIRDIYTLIAPYIEDPEALSSFYVEYLKQEELQKQALAEDLLHADTEHLRLLASSLVLRAALEKRFAEKILDSLEPMDTNKKL